MIFSAVCFFQSALYRFSATALLFVSLTYGTDFLHEAIHAQGVLAPELNLLIIAGFCVVLFYVSVRNVEKTWIV
jgi:ABC-2 type transport system permease protein